jgi:hypothetical protein
MVGPQVGRGDVGVGTDHVVNFVDELAGDSFQLPAAKLGGADIDAAFGAAVGQIDQRRLPSHQRGQAADLVEVDFVVIAKSALHGSAGAIVLHAVADERTELAVVHLDGDLYLDFAAGSDEIGADAVGQLELVGSAMEVHLDGVEGAHGWRGSQGGRAADRYVKCSSRIVG